MTDQEIEKLAGELAEAISIAITPVVRQAVRDELAAQTPQPQKRPTITVPKRG